MIDLRDQLADFEDAARRLLTAPRPCPRLVLVAAPRVPQCHPAREYFARTLCRGCYEYHRYHGTLDDFPRANRPLADFADDYRLLRSEGYTRTQIATRLGMTRNSLDRAYLRAVDAGALTPDRRVA